MHRARLMWSGLPKPFFTIHFKFTKIILVFTGSFVQPSLHDLLQKQSAAVSASSCRLFVFYDKIAHTVSFRQNCEAILHLPNPAHNSYRYIPQPQCITYVDTCLTETPHTCEGKMLPDTAGRPKKPMSQQICVINS